MVEIWKSIPGFEGLYEISSLGNIKSLDRYVNHNSTFKALKKGKILKQKINKLGYKSIVLYSKNKRFYKYIHRLVAIEFIDNPEDKQCVNHIDGNPYNNNVKNLEWSTYKENIKHALDNDLMNPPIGERCAQSKIKKADVIDIRRAYSNTGIRQSDIARIYKLDQSTVSNIINRKIWKHIK